MVNPVDPENADQLRVMLAGLVDTVADTRTVSRWEGV
jgi:hypothetical protein